MWFRAIKAFLVQNIDILQVFLRKTTVKIIVAGNKTVNVTRMYKVRHRGKNARRVASRSRGVYSARSLHFNCLLLFLRLLQKSWHILAKYFA